MSVLHIEHRISDFEIWKGAFDAFATKRRVAGVSHERVCRPVDDSHYVVIELDFTTTEQARAFLDFLQQAVWSSPADAPALVGRPAGRVFDVAYEASPDATRPGAVRPIR
jgi:hypothetical protein